MPWTIKELAEMCDGEAVNRPSAKIDNFRPADRAGAGDLTFVSSAKWMGALKKGAAAVISPGMEERVGDRPLIVAENPRLAFAKILGATRPVERPEPGIDPRAAVAKDALIGKNVHIGPLACVEKGASIGDRTALRPGAHVSERAKVGCDCVLHPHSYVGPDSILGDRVILGPGASVGHDGFGYQWDGERHVKVPQVGIAVIEDDVEIGVLAAVDRAMMGETRVGKGTKIDNLVMVAHNCDIGENVILVAQVGLAGSVTIGDGAILAGQAGVADGVHIGKGAILEAQSGVAKNVPPGKIVAGTPARSRMKWLRGELVVDRLPNLLKKMTKLEQRLKNLEEKQGSEDAGKK